MQLALEEIAALWIFSYVGYGIRYATERFSSATDILASGSPIYSDLYANIVGCCWMGMMVTVKGRFVGQYEPLFLGLTTGLAGSLTTFSAWNAGASLAVWDLRISVHIFFLQLVISLGMSLLSFFFGVHLLTLGRYLSARLSRRHSNIDIAPPPAAELATEVEVPHPPALAPHPPHLYVVMGLGSALLLALFLAFFFTVTKWRALWFAFLLAPIGTLVRFYVSLLNKRFLHFPLGTFLVNVSGTLLFNGLILIWNNKTGLISVEFDRSGSAAYLWLIPGFSSGFCGCLTTVSTFINELVHLHTHRAYVYALASVAITQLLLGVMNGPFFLR